MTDLQTLRDRVRTQTETTSTELPDSTIDGYLQEAYNRTIAAEAFWPFFEHTWQVNQQIGEATLAEPPDCGEIVSLIDVVAPCRLEQLNYEQAEDMFLGSLTSVGTARAYSRWNGELVLWPAVTYEEIRVYQLRGYRTPTDWIAAGASSEPDCDSRLHLCLANYAIAMAYGQQEDMELEKNYMDRWAKDAEMARQVIMGADFHRPLIVGRRFVTPIGATTYMPPFVVDLGT